MLCCVVFLVSFVELEIELSWKTRICASSPYKPRVVADAYNGSPALWRWRQEALHSGVGRLRPAWATRNFILTN